MTPGPRSTLPPSTTVSPTEDTTVTATSSLTSPLTSSTAVNPTSVVSTVTSTLTTDVTVRPTSLTSPLAPSTAVNPTSDLTVSPTLTTDTPKSPTERGQSSTDSVVNSNSPKIVLSVQLWQTAVCMASGVGVFLMGLTAVYLCRRTKKTNSQRPTTRQDDHSQCDLVMGAMSSADMLDSRDAGIYSLITSVPSTFLPSVPVQVSANEDVSTAKIIALDIDTYLFSYGQADSLRDNKDLSLSFLQADSENAGVYSLITSVPSTSIPLGPFEENGKSSENDNSDTYHVYSSIPDRPATSAQPDGLYSLLQTH
ncbi:putative GPI-anchored protein pfl2 [Salmo salar]|uniref:GPI-anchored protein pfl2 n=1 Tax=Salmo salar TaxID=8030 RepID=A0ABM3CN63_SALSA|nr:putative GPI-anchored protein pfl2 [Salmo salar]